MVIKVPEINVDALNRELQGVVKRVNIDGLTAKANEAVSQFKAINESKLAAELGKVAGGFESLTAELDDLEGLEEFEKVATKGIALLKENAPGLKAIAKQSPAIAGDLQKLTGEAIDGGLLDFKVTAPTAKAMSKALQELTGEPLEKIAGSLQSVADQALPDLEKALNTAVGKGLPVGNDFLSEVNKFASGLEGQIGNLKNGFSGQLKNLSEELNGQLGPALTQIAGGAGGIASQLRPQLSNAAQLLQTTNLPNLASTLSTANVSGVAAALQSTAGAIQPTLSGLGANLQSSASQLLGSTSLSATAQTLQANLNTNTLQIVSQLKPRVAQLLESNEISKAAELLKRRSALPLAEIESKLSAIPVTLAEKVTRDAPLPFKSTLSRLIG